ncbi:hypothetical protein RF11_01721 [Thelohanellus kitauei]|uniref:Uncharacterized protein n=1 Tax=Thelohanellus kitauei TaxID=669202 RepID=A0A0C2M654_THEKT|nr:hypothetical protein RF11_01721 [Thelohanellus kitauei]
MGVKFNLFVLGFMLCAFIQTDLLLEKSPSVTDDDAIKWSELDTKVPGKTDFLDTQGAIMDDVKTAQKPTDQAWQVPEGYEKKSHAKQTRGDKILSSDAYMAVQL